MKTKQTRLISNIFLGVMGAIALCLVLLAIIPKSYNVLTIVPNQYGTGANDAPYKIAVYDGNMSAKYECSSDASESQKKAYNEIIALYNSMFSTSSLNSLFSRDIAYSPDYDYDNTFLSNLISKNSYVLEFNYNDRQTLYKNGKPYTNAALTGSEYVDKIATFDRVWVTINEGESFNTLSFYLENLGYRTRSIIKIETLANTHNLYEFLSNLNYSN